MSKITQLLLTIGILALLTLAACSPDEEEPEGPTEDPLAQQGAAQATQIAAQATVNAQVSATFVALTVTSNPTLAEATARSQPPTEIISTEGVVVSPTPTPTITPTRTPVPPTAPPTEDPYADTDILGNTLYEREWLNAPFEGYQQLDENINPILETYQLQDFEGSVIFIMFVNTECQQCNTFLINVKRQASEYASRNPDKETVYITMHTNRIIPYNEIVFWAEPLGLNNYSEGNLTWINARLSPDLFNEVSDLFESQDILTPETYPLVIIDGFQRTHVSQGLLQEERLRDLIIYYNEGITATEGE